jgi:hypothetical protein
MDCQLEQAQQWTDCWGNISVATNVTTTCNTPHTRGQSVSGWSLDGQLLVHHDRHQLPVSKHASAHHLLSQLDSLLSNCAHC